MFKKGDTHMWWIIVVALIALLVSIFIIIWFRNSGGSAFGAIDKNIDSLKDCDGDRVADFFDKCPCDAAYGEIKPPEGTKCTACPITCVAASPTAAK